MEETKGTNSTPDQGTSELVGTSKKLFGNKPPESSQADVSKAPETAKPTDEATEPVLDLDKFKGYKVKAKVDGQEEEVTLEALLKSYQTDKTISQRGQQLGAERRALADERKRVDEAIAKIEAMANPAQNRNTAQQSDGFEYMDETTKAYFSVKEAEHKKEIERLNATLNDLSASLMPIRVQNEYNAIASVLKSRNPAYDDFMSKVGEIENTILSMPKTEQASFATPEGMMIIYQDLKFRESQRPANQSVRVTQVEGGTNTGTGVRVSNSEQLKSTFKAFKEANARPTINSDDARSASMEYLKALGL